MRRGLAGVEAAAAVAPPNELSRGRCSSRPGATRWGSGNAVPNTCRHRHKHDPSRPPRQRRAPDSPAQQRASMVSRVFARSRSGGSPAAAGGVVYSGHHVRGSGGVPGIFRIMVPRSASPPPDSASPQPSPDSALPPRRMRRLRRSGYLRAPVTESADDVKLPPSAATRRARRRCRNLAVSDLGDAGLGHAEGLGELCLGHPGRGTHLGQLAPAHVRFPALAGSGLAAACSAPVRGSDARPLALTSLQLA